MVIIILSSNDKLSFGNIPRNLLKFSSLLSKTVNAFFIWSSLIFVPLSESKNVLIRSANIYCSLLSTVGVSTVDSADSVDSARSSGTSIIDTSFSTFPFWNSV